MTELHHFHPARKGSGSLCPFPIYPLYTRTVILSLDKPIADCFLFRPRKSCENRRKRSHTNVSNASVIRTSRVSQTPLQAPFPTSINGYHAAKKFLSQWPAKRSTFAFTSESEYTLGSAQRIAHSGSHGETGAFRTGPLSLPSAHSARSRTSPGRVSERQTLPLLGLGRVCSRRTRRAFGTAMRSCVSLFRRRRGPAGLRDPVSTLWIMW